MEFAALLDPEFWRPLLGSLIGAAAALATGAAAAWLVITFAERWAQRTLTPADDIVVKGLASPVRWLLPLSALISVHPWLGMSDGPRAAVKQLLVVAITLNVGWGFLRLIRIRSEERRVGKECRSRGA